MLGQVSKVVMRSGSFSSSTIAFIKGEDGRSYFAHDGSRTINGSTKNGNRFWEGMGGQWISFTPMTTAKGEAINLFSVLLDADKEEQALADRLWSWNRSKIGVKPSLDYPMQRLVNGKWVLVLEPVNINDGS